MVGYHMVNTNSGNVVAKARCECGYLINVEGAVKNYVVSEMNHSDYVSKDEYEKTIGEMKKHILWRYCPMCGKRVGSPEKVDLRNVRGIKVGINAFLEGVREGEHSDVRNAIFVNRFGYFLDKAHNNVTWAKKRAYEVPDGYVIFKTEG